MVENNFAASDLWSAIDGVASRSGKSLADLAIKAGLPRHSLLPEGRSVSDGQLVWPPMPTITAVIMAAGVSLREFGALVDAAQRRRTECGSIWNEDQQVRNRASG